MAALSIPHSLHKTNTLIPQHKPKRFLLLLSCQRGDSIDAPNPKAKQQVKHEKVFISLGKFGKGLKDNLSPKHKGDWKDVALMSLSFAVYVYISQKIVCAYCAWMSILNSNQW